MSCRLCETPPGEEPEDLEWEDLCDECQYWITEAKKEGKIGEKA